MSGAEIIAGGFADPVFAAQTSFRAVMDALSRPGRACGPLAAALPPAPLTAGQAAVALTLCDRDTPVWLGERLAASEAVRQWLGFHTGAPITADRGNADFAFLDDAAALADLETFAQGSDEYPDRSATLVVPVAALDGGAALALEGPGIEHTAAIAPAGLPDGFLAAWRDNNALYPRGVDLLLTCGDRIVGLPRTTRIVGQGG